jgi:hypothetical protein
MEGERGRWVRRRGGIRIVAYDAVLYYYGKNKAQEKTALGNFDTGI